MLMADLVQASGKVNARFYCYHVAFHKKTTISIKKQAPVTKVTYSEMISSATHLVKDALCFGGCRGALRVIQAGQCGQ